MYSEMFLADTFVINATATSEITRLIWSSAGSKILIADSVRSFCHFKSIKTSEIEFDFYSLGCYLYTSLTQKENRPSKE